MVATIARSIQIGEVSIGEYSCGMILNGNEIAESVHSDAEIGNNRNHDVRNL